VSTPFVRGLPQENGGVDESRSRCPRGGVQLAAAISADAVVWSKNNRASG